MRHGDRTGSGKERKYKGGSGRQGQRRRPGRPQGHTGRGLLFFPGHMVQESLGFGTQCRLPLQSALPSESKWSPGLASGACTPGTARCQLQASSRPSRSAQDHLGFLPLPFPRQLPSRRGVRPSP